MRRSLAVVLSTLAACASGRPPRTTPLPIEGIWKSDRDRTLQVLEASGPWSEKQWKAFSDPTLFGHLVQIFQGETYLVAYEGSCAPEPIEILEVGPDFVRERDRNAFTQETEELTLRVADDHRYVPIMLLQGHPTEVFSRVTADDAIREHPCLAPILGRDETLHGSARSGP